jgi:sigma-B regulation protein RsbU (phosphoserine phosphatase)
MPREILIQGSDGKSTNYQLTGDRVTLGRSSTTELCFADDAGLSRQHMALERDGDDWTVQDLGSKNGTQVNNIPLKGKLKLKPGDRITAGHLVIVYDDRASTPAQTGPVGGAVVFYEIGESEAPSTSTVVTSLEGALSDQTIVKDTGGRGAAQMKALIHAGQELATNRPLSELFKKILDLSIEAVGAQRGVLMTLEADRLVVRANKGEGFRISSAVRDRVLKEKNSLLVKDTQMDDAFRERLSIVEQKVRTLMAVPLQTKDQIIGLIYLDSPFFIREFTVDDLNLITVMANTAAIRIEHARLVEVEQAERIMARDLDQAADIQRRNLPSEPPVVAGADIAGYNAPCRTVGGDYYDFFTYENGRVAMALGDVSGKGMPASLMMMGLQARVQQALFDEPEDLGAAMTRINKITCPKCPSNRFITFFFCVMDPKTGRVAYANAGHNPPLLVRANKEIEMLPGGGPPLGILPTAQYAAQEVTMQQGDLLAIYSDGVTEANNPQEEEFGEDRFGELLAANQTKSAEQIMGEVNAALVSWAEGGPPADDITLVVAKRV